MGCEICGRSSCTKSFHSLEEQNEYSNVAEEVLERVKRNISYFLNRLPCEEIENEVWIKLEDAIKIVEDYN
jgi:hypothetical protein